ncbi:MAG: IS200/IS605 family transposase [Gammaproteobacteria bacterium]|nr:IS200/IS605 family transposase [Gammaproteobacteria bacterium]
MSQSLTNIIVHIIFSTKKRQKYLSSDIQQKLYAFITKLLQNRGCKVIKIGGISDHIHILCSISKKCIFTDIIKEIKVASSKWIKTVDSNCTDFHWQNGFGAFSVSPINIDLVINYIANQENHHKKFDFQQELRAILNKYKMPFDERYIWD